MNIVLLSPNFPPQLYLFASALRRHGHSALGIGDVDMHLLTPEQQQAMTAWYRVDSLDRYGDVYRAVAFLIHRHGRIDRIESFNEHWLELEARLREDFNVSGPSLDDVARHRGKSRRRDTLKSNGVPCVPGEKVTSPEQVRAFVDRHGLPVIFKPEQRAPRRDRFQAWTRDELDALLRRPLDSYVVERFERARLTSFDGLTDRQGRIVYRTSHEFRSASANERAAVYWSRRRVPRALEEVGRRVVEAFRMRERFFHCELFEESGGSFRVLDINMRPPYGFAIDLMNYAADIDIYNLWARVLSGEDVAKDFRYELKYHVAHVGRRRYVEYEFSPRELSERLGSMLVLHRPIPYIFSEALGDEMYILRHEDLTTLFEGIDLVTQ